MDYGSYFLAKENGLNNGVKDLTSGEPRAFSMSQLI